MKSKLIKIAISIATASMLLFFGHAEARTSTTGVAELTYVNFDAKAANPPAGKESRFSGNSFAQRYSLAWNATNLYHRSQLQYYDVSLSYDWLNFDTKISEGSSDTRIKDVFGKFGYYGDIGYNPANLPVKLRIFANDTQSLSFNRDIHPDGLIGDKLFYAIDGKTKSESFGASFTFEPDLARTLSLRGLPKLNLDYNETFVKSNSAVFYAVDYSTKELSVAGLSKGNNWLKYRTLSYEDRLDISNNFNQQQLQIGLVDYSGRRLWSSLTNWIEVSADGQLTNRRATTDSEEYDVNFMAIATRRTWNARTFMNYNRIMTTAVSPTDTDLKETVRVPLYIRGIYGSETDWYMRVSTERGTRSQYFPTTMKDTSYSNTVAVGGTTFSRSDFTLSPALIVSTSKGFGSADSLDLKAAVETNSTSRYSNKLGLAARSEFSYLDDGYDTKASKSWNNRITFKADYRPDSKFVYNITEAFEAGKESSSSSQFTGLTPYVQSTTSALVSWTPTAEFTAALQGTYYLRKNENHVNTRQAEITHRLTYDKKETTYRLDTKYKKTDDNSASSWDLTNSGSLQYRPDRNNDASLRYTYNASESSGSRYSKIELKQKYNYNFFTRSGVARNFASLTQEFEYVGYEFNKARSYSQYLQLGGRYSPTERLSLTGSMRYQNSNSGSTTIYYNAGLNADFKLLSTSLDYAYAKRDSDNRIEKRFSATVRRSF